MIIDNIKLIDGSIQNAVVEQGIALPTTELESGRIFYLTQVQGPNDIGLYIYSGAEWVLFSSSDYVDSRIAELIGTAPETLNSLSELATALGDDPNFILTINTKVDNEETRATAAEAAVASDLSTEVSRATAAEAAVQAAVDSEESTRIASDANLQGQITAEVSARTSDVSGLQAQIDSNLSTGNSSVATKVSKSGDTMTGPLTLPALNPTGTNDAIPKKMLDAAVSTLDATDAAEQAARVAADNALDSRITTEVSDRQAAITVVQASVTSETTRASSAEAANTLKIDTEISDRASSDVTLQGSITDEINRAQTEEARLQTAIDGIVGVGGSNDSEEAARIAGDTNLQGQVTANASAISTETTARIATDADLQGQLDNESSGRASSDVNLQANIDAEATARIAGDATLQSNIDTKLAATAKAVDSDKLDNLNSSQFARTDVSSVLAVGADFSIPKAPTLGDHATNKTYVDATIDAVIAAAPGALDTLNELAAALANDPNFATTITNQIAAEETARIAADNTLTAAVNTKLAATAKAVDSDKLDNLNSTQFLRSDVADTMTALLSLTQTPTSGNHATNKAYVDGQVNAVKASYSKRLTVNVTANTTLSAAYDESNFHTVCFVDTSAGAKTVTLPAAPETGCMVSFVDVESTFGPNQLTIARNSKLIMGFADDMAVSTTNASVTLIYSGSANGWRLVY